MESVIFDSNNFGKVPNKPSRFDMAISFYCVVKQKGEYYLVTYFYNPKWNLYYPFYDDINKTPVLKQSKAITFSELTKETDETIKINEEEKIDLAIKRFYELVGSSCSVVKNASKHILYELKYSKTTNTYTVYKLYNYIITKVDNLSKVLNPNNLKCKLYKLNKLNNKEIISNAIEFVNCAKEELIKYAIEIN